MGRQPPPVRPQRCHRYRYPDGRGVHDPRETASVAPTRALPERRGATVGRNGPPADASVGRAPTASVTTTHASAAQEATTPRWTPARGRPEGAAPRLQPAVPPADRLTLTCRDIHRRIDQVAGKH